MFVVIKYFAQTVNLYLEKLAKEFIDSFDGIVGVETFWGAEKYKS